MELQHSSYAERVTRFLERVEFRRADDEQDKNAIYRLRHEAYIREGSVAPRPSGLFSDPDDETPNAWLMAIFIDGGLASSIRLHVSTSPSQRLPAMTVFPDLVEPHLRAGRCIIDATRLVTRLEYSRQYSFMPFLGMRLAFLAADYFGADYITAALREEHQKPYERTFGAQRWAEPRAYPNFVKRMAFMGYDCALSGRATRARYPFFNSLGEERHALFRRSSTTPRDASELILVEDGDGSRKQVFAANFA